MALRHILKHQLTPLRVVEHGAWIEGELEEDVEEGEVFLAAFFPPGTREAGGRGRRSETPQMIYRDPDPAGTPVALSALDRVRLAEAPDVGLEFAGVYQVDGPPQPLGRPGRAPRAWLAQLKRIAD